MRMVATLAASLVVVLGGGIATAAAQPGDVRALSAICGHAFTVAAERMTRAGPKVELPPPSSTASPEPGAGSPPDDAGSAAGPPASPSVEDAASPSVTAESPAVDDAVAGGIAAEDRLDEAVRVCASLDDWLEAAGLYPDVIGSMGAVAFLGARCADPSADLQGFASCQSLAAALATPAPVVEPPATQEPSATPRVDRPKVDPEPPSEPTGRRNGGVRISPDFKARIPGATEVRYFTISGSTARQLLRQNLRKAGKHCRTHRAVACVEMTWSVSFERDGVGGNCHVARAATSLRATVFLPRWTRRAGAHRDLVRWWRKVMKDSAVHEARHIRIQRKHLADYRRAVSGRPCRAAQRILQRHTRRADKAQAAFDRREYAEPLPPLPESLR